ncbi:MAG: tRNA ((37)-N6)-threonylcarbamoyltransferase complex ATPase subunit type 1 TsaE [Bacteroidota bacterium]
MKEYQVSNLDELQHFAQEFVSAYTEPGVFLLNGHMGAGKTTMVNALCKAWGIEESSSPTFSLVNEYANKDGIRIFHFDLYRLKNIDEALDIGFEEYLDQKAFVFIEWPEIILPLLDRYVEISIRAEGQIRLIQLKEH